MRPNTLRGLLKAGKPSLGTHLFSTWPTTVEVVGHSAMFDYVEFCAEYAPFNLYTLDDFCRAAELYNLGAMIKVDQEPRAFIAQRAIGSGFQSVLFADIRTAADARAAVKCARPETPSDAGTYGVAMRRNALMSYGGTETYVQALRDTVVVFMIEKQSAVDNLEAILSVGGVDMVQWGPADFSMSSGHIGGYANGDPYVAATEKKVIETCLRLGIPPRAEINSPEQAKAYIDLGVRHFCIGWDLTVLFSWMRGNGEAMRKILETA